ncbi:NAD(P)-dependent oxidoreductase [Paenibacillus sp. FSL H7-0331]|uniref:NAD-dependent epimerase/dehydratase family protein n=1 Tax=Paenibacillus sp. FSL H7-0331 TaxID=1920421 RepID=UPI00096EC228|nr:NAD(P)-dependent oxidoreductase [Paenibacillus sp. FSL H7-0331]OMF00451.1 epimerase [Paenibacillus sp. FSL H7-0331]
MKTVAVTGASGKLGNEVVKQLLEEGYQVVALDERKSDQFRCKQIRVDLNDFGQVVAGLAGVDAVIHLAAIPAPLDYTHSTIFSNNVVSTYHVLEAASVLGIGKVALGSSESSYGFCWAPSPFDPLYVPVDEDHPQLPQECYGLSKIVNELTASMFHRRTGMQVMSLRFSMIVAPQQYPSFEPDIRNPEKHKRILWSYIDIRDAVRACIASIGTLSVGSADLNITSRDTLSDRDTEQLLDQFYPEVKDRRQRFAGREAIVSTEQAFRVLNWKAEHSWSDTIQR